MGIFDRLSRVVRSNVNAMLDSAEDPDKLLAQTISEMESGLKQARRELVETLGTAKRLEKEAAELAKECADWESKAALALRQGDEDLARQALKQKLLTERKVAQVRERAAQSSAASETMKAGIETVEQRTADLKARKGTVASQVRAARSADASTASAPATTGGKAFDDLERLGGRIDQLEAEVEAAQVLEDPRKAELEARFRELEQDSRSQVVEDQLAELKRKVQDS